MATTYTLISSNVLSSSAASVTFSGIPATYTDLVVKWSARLDNNSVDEKFTLGATGGTAHSETIIKWNPAVYVASGRFTGSAYVETLSVASTWTSNTFSNSEAYIPNYANTSYNKPFSVFSMTENNSTDAWSDLVAGLINSTSAISQLTIAPASGNYVSGSSFYLYGVSNA
jgi:hypothetical protein